MYYQNGGNEMNAQSINYFFIFFKSVTMKFWQFLSVFGKQNTAQQSLQFKLTHGWKIVIFFKSSHLYLYIALYTIQIVSKQLYSVNRKIMQEDNNKENVLINYIVFIYLFILRSTFYNPKSEKVGTVWKTQIKKESSDF